MSNEKFISIPPYISTSWKNIRALRMEDTHLIITLTDGSVVRVPSLNNEDVEQIFAGHAAYLENHSQTAEKPLPKSNSGPLPTDASFGNIPFRFGLGADGLPQAVQHDPSQANAPDLPPEILEKVGSIAKILSPGDSALLPKPEPHCNCMHCQIARAISGETEEEELPQQEEEEEVSEEDLRFREWDVKEISNGIFEVSDPSAPEEIFRVCLKPPGCTCGEKNCEHLLYVLRS